MTSAGPVPTPPSTLQTNLIEGVAATNPDYTANLPGTLIEDISSTDVGALVTMDQARVDAVNNVTPYAANPYVLAQLGIQFGIPQGLATNTSVYVVFTGPAGYVIPAGFIVSDGTYQYVIQDGGVLAASGNSSSLYAIASQSGSWAVPANTVNQIVTSVPTGYTLTVNNPYAGTSGSGAQSVEDYRSQILVAGKAAAQGLPDFLRTQLQKISGVVPRLISILQTTNGWEIICGGGDSNQVAGAIYNSVIDLSILYGSATNGRNILVSLINPPDVYEIVYVNPPQQVVTATVTWNTNLTNFTASSQVNQLAAPALVSYINGIIVGQPINENAMTDIFATAVSSVLPLANISSLTYSVSINGTVTPPSAGTQLIPSDPESYFYSADNGITVVQG
ncbi:MAG: baseplate J/gp47 family protein [Pseudomonadota bacterium]|nr:baseplate J/gp47 family protein [Pseudomonadota bacterium]